MSRESGGYTCHLLLTPNILLTQKEQAMQEEMAWKSHKYGPAAAKIGYRSGKDGGEKRYSLVLGWRLPPMRVGGYAGDEREASLVSGQRLCPSFSCM
jgi:hypothetical protein